MIIFVVYSIAMKTQFAILKATRNHLYNYLDHYDLHTLNRVPTGFKNSLFWSAAHILVTQQLLCYYLSANSLIIEDEWVKRFKKGTEAADATQDDLDTLLKLIKKSAVQLQDDYYDGLFTEYKSYVTSYGFELTNIDDAISFNNVHEGLHLGYMMALRKSL